jgi:hypothetical protein
MARRLRRADDAAIPSTPPEPPMNSSLRPRTIVHHRVPRVQPPADGIAVVVDDDNAAPCGWYESSFALRQGLAVSELSDGDACLAAQWFGDRASVALQ